MPKALIACGAVIATLLAGLGWQSWQLSEERRTAGQTAERLETCRQASRANLANLREFERALADCIGENTVIEAERAADAARRALEADRLAERTRDSTAAVRDAAGLDACAVLPVPGAAVERLRDAADRAHRAGHPDRTPVGARPR